MRRKVFEKEPKLKKREAHRTKSISCKVLQLDLQNHFNSVLKENIYINQLLKFEYLLSCSG